MIAKTLMKIFVSLLVTFITQVVFANIKIAGVYHLNNSLSAPVLFGWAPYKYLDGDILYAENITNKKIKVKFLSLETGYGVDHNCATIKESVWLKPGVTTRIPIDGCSNPIVNIKVTVNGKEYAFGANRRDD